MFLHHLCSSSSQSRLISASGIHRFLPAVHGFIRQIDQFTPWFDRILVSLLSSLLHIPGSPPSPDGAVSSNVSEVSGGETSKVVECHCTLGAERFHSGEQGAMLGEKCDDGSRVKQLRLFGC